MLLPGPSLSPLGVSGKRRTSGGGTSSPVAGYSLWLKADAGVLNGAGSAASDGDAVATWQDQSGNGNDATQSTGGSRPTYKTSIVNGLPVLRFNGFNSLSLTATLAADPCTVLAVFRPDSSSVLTIVAGDTGGLQYRLDGLQQRLVKTNTADMGFGTGTLSTSAFSSGGVRYSTSASQANLRLDGASDGDKTPLSLSNPFQWIGSKATVSEAFSGDIAELLIYPSALSDADRGTTETYLASRYGL